MLTLGVMQGLQVSEVARRAGMTPSAVRFYERVGVLQPARRAANGYRLFDDAAVEQLRIVSQAKGIGMSLEDITDLTAAWPGGECRAVQDRIRGFLTRRIGEAREQGGALQVLEHRLLAALGRLAAVDSGMQRCGTGCGCETALDGQTAPEGETGTAPADPGPQDAGVPAASRGGGREAGRPGCTLDSDALAARLGEWRALARAAASAERAGGGVRLVLPASPEVIAAAAGLCAAETACCAQTRFVLEITAGGAILTAEAPGAPGLADVMIPAGSPG
jgi:DNA-binding transcriptional MerR regulator